LIVLSDFITKNFFNFSNESKRELERFKRFVRRTKSIFENDPILMMRIFRNLLQLNKADSDDLEDAEE